MQCVNRNFMNENFYVSGLFIQVLAVCKVCVTSTARKRRRLKK